MSENNEAEKELLAAAELGQWADDGQCPSCHMIEDDGHHRDCGLFAALRRIRPAHAPVAESPRAESVSEEQLRDIWDRHRSVSIFPTSVSTTLNEEVIAAMREVLALAHPSKRS